MRPPRQLAPAPTPTLTPSTPAPKPQPSTEPEQVGSGGALAAPAPRKRRQEEPATPSQKKKRCTTSEVGAVAGRAGRKATPQSRSATGEVKEEPPAEQKGRARAVTLAVASYPAETKQEPVPGPGVARKRKRIVAVGSAPAKPVASGNMAGPSAVKPQRKKARAEPSVSSDQAEPLVPEVRSRATVLRPPPVLRSGFLQVVPGDTVEILNVSDDYLEAANLLLGRASDGRSGWVLATALSCVCGQGDQSHVVPHGKPLGPLIEECPMDHVHNVRLRAFVLVEAQGPTLPDFLRLRRGEQLLVHELIDVSGEGDVMWGRRYGCCSDKGYFFSKDVQVLGDLAARKQARREAKELRRLLCEGDAFGGAEVVGAAGSDDQ